MKKFIGRSGLGAVLSLALVLAVGQAQALQILTFDTKNPGRNEVSGGLGFTVTKVGANAVPELDLSMFDLIYVAPPLDEFLGSLGLGAGYLDEFIANGGRLVYGKVAPGPGFTFPTFPTLPTLPPPPVVGIDAGPSTHVAAVPEPGTLALFGLGAAGLLLLRRRRKTRA